MVSKQSKSTKAAKKATRKTKKTTKKAGARSRAKPPAGRQAGPVFHKLHNDDERMLKIEWSDDHNDLAASPVSMRHAAQAAKLSNPPFCKNKLNDPTRKYYCEFDAEANQYICIEVDANDPRCG